MDVRKNIHGQNEKEYLNNYTPERYERPSVTVDMVLFTIDDVDRRDNKRLPDKELKVLLIKRKEHPFIDNWAVPGGFVGINESLEEAVQRELKEETNIEDIYLEQLYTWGDVNRDPRMRVISTSYMALVDKKKLMERAGSDASELGWFTIKRELVKSKLDNDGNKVETYIITLLNEAKDVKIYYKVQENTTSGGNLINTDIVLVKSSTTELAFDHIKILNYALKRMNNKVEYTNIAFTLLPEYFTLTELQQVFEILLGRKLIKPNFRRWINSRVEETEFQKKEGSYRPSKLYKLKSGIEGMYRTNI